MPGVDIEVIRHATGNKTKRIKLTVAHILEYLRLKKVKLPVNACEIYVRCTFDDEYSVGDKIPINSVEIQYHEQKKA